MTGSIKIRWKIIRTGEERLDDLSYLSKLFWLFKTDFSEEDLHLLHGLFLVNNLTPNMGKQARPKCPSKILEVVYDNGSL